MHLNEGPFYIANMKVEHYVSFPEIVERHTGKVVFKLEYLLDYKPEDFNIHLAVSLLAITQLVDEATLAEYSAFKHDYLYNKRIKLPEVTYTGPLADQYSLLETEKQKIMDDPDYRLNIGALFNNIHFGDEIPEDLPDISDAREVSLNLMKMQRRIMTEIAKEVKGHINTISWPRDTNNRFNYALPAKLIFDVFEYESRLLPKLNELAGQIVQGYESKPEVDEYGDTYWYFTINSNLL